MIRTGGIVISDFDNPDCRDNDSLISRGPEFSSSFSAVTTHITLSLRASSFIPRSIKYAIVVYSVYRLGSGRSSPRAIVDSKSIIG